MLEAADYESWEAIPLRTPGESRADHIRRMIAIWDERRVAALAECQRLQNEDSTDRKAIHRAFTVRVQAELGRRVGETRAEHKLRADVLRKKFINGMADFYHKNRTYAGPNRQRWINAHWKTLRELASREDFKLVITHPQEIGG